MNSDEQGDGIKPAGWYPHPLDPSWESHWDGSTWDGPTRPKALQASPAATEPLAFSPTAVAAPAGKKSRTWVPIVISISLAVAFFAVKYLATNSDSATAPVGVTPSDPSQFGVIDTSQAQDTSCPSGYYFKDSEGNCWVTVNDYQKAHGWGQ